MQYYSFLVFILLTLSFQACQKDPLTRQPKALAITEIALLSYPSAKPNGNSWDLSTGPDIFIALNEGTGLSSASKVTSLANNATRASYTFSLSSPITINNLLSNWSIGAYDEDDFDPDDYMGGVYFKPSDYQDGLPETILLTTTEVQIRLQVTWNF